MSGAIPRLAGATLGRACRRAFRRETTAFPYDKIEYRVNPASARFRSAAFPRGFRGGAPVDADAIRAKRSAREVEFSRKDAERLFLPKPNEPHALGTYRSCLTGRIGSASGERLEFLGDAVLYLLVTEKLFSARDESLAPLCLTPRQMHDSRQPVIGNRHLAEAGRAAGIDCFVSAGGGKGEDPPVTDKRIADAVEALIGAVYTVAGPEAAAAWVDRWITPSLGAGN